MSFRGSALEPWHDSRVMAGTAAATLVGLRVWRGMIRHGPDDHRPRVRPRPPHSAAAWCPESSAPASPASRIETGTETAETAATVRNAAL